ncbi:hypothetical protein [Dysosmobacter sp.]
MKFKLCHDPERKTLSIPRAALQISGLDGQDELHLHADDGCVLLLPKRLTTGEAVKAIRMLKDISTQLISNLAAASRHTSVEECECLSCGHRTSCFGICIPPCQLEEAGIDPESELATCVQEGRILVLPMEKPDGDQLLDELDEDLRSMLTDSGVLLAGVRHLLEYEGYCHE